MIWVDPEGFIWVGPGHTCQSPKSISLNPSPNFPRFYHITVILQLYAQAFLYGLTGRKNCIINIFVIHNKNIGKYRMPSLLFLK